MGIRVVADIDSLSETWQVTKSFGISRCARKPPNVLGRLPDLSVVKARHDFARLTVAVV